MITREFLIKEYESFVNDYITIEKFADHNGLHENEAIILIDLLKQVYNKNHPDY